MKKVIVLLAGLNMYISHAQTDLSVFNVYFGQGIRDMKGINYIGYSTDMSLQLGSSPLLFGASISGGDYGERVENLPRYTVEDGYGENVRATSRGGVINFGTHLRYSPLYFEEKRLQPYIELGGGRVSYRQKWNTYGELEEGSTSSCPKPLHSARGATSRNGTFYGHAKIGALYRYHDIPFAGAQAYFGFSIRYEHGGLVNFANPKKHKHQFFYDSGLGDEFDRPFQNDVTSGNRALTTLSRHQKLVYELILLRIVF